ncbi:MAG TPA: hypothetical protein VFQ44_06430 [Streptosporangiaceae bacterium]|nr:hypothetical protein [Streptosporangiaceae bacterium]
MGTKGARRPAAGADDLATALRACANVIASQWRRELESTGWSAELSADAPGDIGGRYLPGLLELVARQIQRPSADLAAVYRDELCRYELALTAVPAPRRASATALVAAQRAAVESVMTGAQRTALLSALDDLNGPPAACRSAAPVAFLLLGDCLMNEIRCFLTEYGRRSGVAVRGYHRYFSGALSVPFDVGSVRRLADEHEIDFVALSPCTFDSLPLFRELLIRAENAEADAKSVTTLVGVIEAIVGELAGLIDAPVLLHNACGAPVGPDRGLLTSLPPLTHRGRAAIGVLNAELERLVASRERVTLIDEVRAADRLGLRRATESAIPGGPVAGALFHTSRLGRELGASYWELAEVRSQLGQLRALAVDFDGTLWSGVMADGPVQHFADRQALLRRLRQSGVVLAGLSKGSPESVRWGEMHLTERDFAVVHRSWGAKEIALRQIMSQLRIRQEHVAAIDDNPTERALLAAAFPGLRTLDPDDAATWRRLALLPGVTRGGRSAEARHRTERYQADQARRLLVSEASAVQERMRGLGLTLTFRQMAAADLARVLELLRRTHQFNTTGVAPARSQLLRLMEAGGSHDVFVGHLKDEFGDFGIIAVVIVEREQRVIESFVMSCRAMGYGVEHIILDRVISRCGVPITARLVHTQLNEPCHGLFQSAGFTEHQPGRWLLSERRPVPLPTWFTVHDIGGPF